MPLTAFVGGPIAGAIAIWAWGLVIGFDRSNGYLDFRLFPLAATTAALLVVVQGSRSRTPRDLTALWAGVAFAFTLFAFMVVLAIAVWLILRDGGLGPAN